MRQQRDDARAEATARYHAMEQMMKDYDTLRQKRDDVARLTNLHLSAFNQMEDWRNEAIKDRNVLADVLAALRGEHVNLRLAYEALLDSQRHLVRSLE